MPENNPWVVQEKPAAYVPLPVGFYLADFVSVESKEMPPDGWRWRWTWRVASGEHAGKDATALTGQAIHAGSQAGNLTTGLLGRPLVAGEDVQAAIAACIGKRYMVGQQPGPKGGKPAVRSCGKPPQ
jgi:hypothetical protein